MYKNRLEERLRKSDTRFDFFIQDGIAGHVETNFEGFDSLFKKTLAQVEYDSKNAAPKKPKSFQQSEKSSKTIKGSGLIETKEEKKQRELENKARNELDDEEIERNRELLRGKYVCLLF